MQKRWKKRKMIKYRGYFIIFHMGEEFEFFVKIRIFNEKKDFPFGKSFDFYLQASEKVLKVFKSNTIGILC